MKIEAEYTNGVLSVSARGEEPRPSGPWPEGNRPRLPAPQAVVGKWLPHVPAKDGWYWFRWKQSDPTVLLAYVGHVGVADGSRRWVVHPTSTLDYLPRYGDVGIGGYMQGVNASSIPGEYPVWLHDEIIPPTVSVP